MPNSKKSYYTSESCIENIDPDYNRCITGFAWVHLGDLKRKYKLGKKVIEAKDIQNISLEDISNYITDNFRNIKGDFLDNYFDVDKKYISEEFYNTYLKNPIEYSIQNKIDK